MKSILIIAPHPDDAELGMGGTIIKLVSQGHRVHLVDMTNGEPTPHGSPEIRQREWTAAAKVLGVERTLLGLKNREVQHTIEARHRLAAVIRQHKADWLFVPYPVDAHPDHVAVTKIAEDARFDAKLTKSDIPGEPYHPKRIIYYFCTHLRMNLTPNFCVDISDTIEKKIEAVKCYQSQFVGVSGHVPEMVKSITAYFGSRIGTQYAEPFLPTKCWDFRGWTNWCDKEIVETASSSLQNKVDILRQTTLLQGNGPSSRNKSENDFGVTHEKSGQRFYRPW